MGAVLVPHFAPKSKPRTPDAPDYLGQPPVHAAYLRQSAFDSQPARHVERHVVHAAPGDGGFCWHCAGHWTSHVPPVHTHPV